MIGVLNFNNMIPVEEPVLQQIDLKTRPGDTKAVRAYKELMNDQLTWCNNNRESITGKANKLYEIVTERPEKMIALTRRCCDFKKLENVLEQRLCREEHL